MAELIVTHRTRRTTGAYTDAFADAMWEGWPDAPERRRRFRRVHSPVTTIAASSPRSPARGDPRPERYVDAPSSDRAEPLPLRLSTTSLQLAAGAYVVWALFSVAAAGLALQRAFPSSVVLAPLSGLRPIVGWMPGWLWMIGQLPTALVISEKLVERFAPGQR